MRIVIITGPNLDRLGKRQPDVYGATTLADINAGLRTRADELGVEVDFFQSNIEGELVERVHAAADDGDAVIVNAGGLTHTSVVLRDALAEVADGAGFVEVHISNVHAREEFRHHSYLSAIASGVIVGLGEFGYTAALEYLARK
jgi:3-dehydroquinate dehydratase-2